jgi:drug/metabolite transporter (DMT)-like permease
VVIEAFLFFRAGPTPLAVVGGAVCLVGVALSRRRSRSRSAAVGS